MDPHLIIYLIVAVFTFGVIISGRVVQDAPSVDAVPIFVGSVFAAGVWPIVALVGIVKLANTK